MKFQELKKSLTIGVKPIYLIEGKDGFLRDKSLELIKNAALTFPEFNYDEFTVDKIAESPDTFFATVSSYPFMAEKRFVVLREFYPTAQELKQKLYKQVFTEDFDTTVIIIINENACKNLEKLERITIVDCEKLDEPTAALYVKNECVKQGVVIDNSAVSLLYEFCRGDMTRISMETNKLIAFAGEDKYISCESVNAVTHKDTEYQVYDLAEKVAASNKAEAISILKEMMERTQDKQRVFTIIYYHFRRMFYSAISACDTAELASSLGESEWVMKKLKTQSKKFTPKRLKEINDKLCLLDGDFKQGIISLDDALYSSVLNVLFIDFIKNVPNIVVNDFLSWQGGIVFIILAVAFYLILNVLTTHNATKLTFGFFGYVLACSVVSLVLNATAIQYIILITLGVVFVLLLFATEIKRDVWNTNSAKKLSTAELENAKSSAPTVNRAINEIIKAIQNMSKNDVGAIIVLSNTKMPENIINSGVKLDANISSSLIESIFVPKTPLHDGAMIIQGDKIQAAGCFLPLSQERDLPKDLGTRHRAGIGITETINVTSIIVSEETGIVSYVQRGIITRYADSEALRQVLKDYYWQDLLGQK